MAAAKEERSNGGKKKLPKGTKPDYLYPFLTYAVNNMTEYKEKFTSGQAPDWRIKEALLLAVGHLEDEISQ